MILKDALKTILKPVFQKEEDLNLFLSASDVSAIDFTDEVMANFNKVYLTRDRALTDDDILRATQKDARGYVFGSVDQKLKHLIGKLSTEDQAAINGEKDTLLKIEKLSSAIDNLSKNEDVKKASESFRKKEEELHQKISGLETNIKDLNTNFVKERSGFKVDYFLRNKIAGMKLAPEFSSDKHKEFLASSTIDFLKKTYHLEFDDTSNSVPLRRSVDGAIVDAYEGNAKLSLDDVLKKELEPYIAKNTSEGGDNDRSTYTPPPPRTMQTDQPQTLHEIRLKAAGLI